MLEDTTFSSHRPLERFLIRIFSSMIFVAFRQFSVNKIGIEQGIHKRLGRVDSKARGREGKRGEERCRSPVPWKPNSEATQRPSQRAPSFTPFQRSFSSKATNLILTSTTSARPYFTVPLYLLQ